VNIRGEDKEELYLETARKRFESLGAGEKKEAPMAFRLVKATDDKKAAVVVSISNREFGIFFADTLKFPVGKRYAAKESRVPPDLEAVKAPPLRTAAPKVSVDVKAIDDEGVKDVYAYLGEKKVYYARNRSGGGTFPVRFEVPLEAGSNRLVVFVRDQKDMVASRTYFVFRGEAGDEASNVGLK
jgi:hypothetical protein